MSSSPFIVEWIERLRPHESRDAARTGRAGARPDSGEGRRALDVAMGRGRYAAALARAGFRTFGVDVKIDAVSEAVASAAAAGVRVRAWCADLTQHPLPVARFDVVLVSRYLQRDLFEALRAAVAPGGVVLYETFTTAQRAFGSGPKSPDHLLEPGELRARFDVDGWDVLFYDETSRPEAVARLAAQRRRSG
jgi:SAM-dependent methyltransferase